MCRFKQVALGLMAFTTLACSQAAQVNGSQSAAAQSPPDESISKCVRPVYLTFDTGHMGVAPLIADVLNRHHVKVTFFAANEPTKDGDGTLGEYWAPWWKARAQEGHAFASHTFDHVYWRKDLPQHRFIMRPSAGPEQGKTSEWSAQAYCQELQHANERLQQITGVKPLPLFRAPGGKTSPQLLEVAKSCGFMHVGWADAGFLGDELPSDQYPNNMLLQKALKNIKQGDILMAHLGIWSRQDAWAPAVLEPLIEGLQQKGFCFETLREHPAYKSWIH
jgi:peptidoglycan/xylan/chitin deacetylase (PgdA/CDA1 family)